jgi:hypothetical protein
MGFSEHSPITEDEDLYRAIHPHHWSGDRPSSACFKQTGGPSVDRDGGRDEEEIFSAIDDRQGTDYGIGELSADFCLSETEVHIEPEPLDDNKYHATIYKSEDLDTHPPTSQARKLAKHATVHRKPKPYREEN